MNRAVLKYAALGLATLIAVGAIFAAVDSRSEAVLHTRYPLPPSGIRATSTSEAIAIGQHLVQVSGCSLCHGKDLSGRMMAAAGSPLAAPNLTRIVTKRSDAELDRAIRSGLHPDGTAEFSMPSHVYAAFTDQETAAIIGYLRSLEPIGVLAPHPAWGPMQRFDLAAGFMHPEPRRIAGAARPLDLGPKLESGRHLAALACGQCHGTDLSSGHGAPGPDLMVRGGYSLAQFRALMHDGETPSGRELGLMSATARSSFSHFTEAEVAAIYAYLDARDVRLAAPPPKSGG